MRLVGEGAEEFGKAPFGEDPEGHVFAGAREARFRKARLEVFEKRVFPGGCERAPLALPHQMPFLLRFESDQVELHARLDVDDFLG